MNQKAKVFELNTEYDVYDAQGRKLGMIRQIGQNVLRRAVGVRSYENRTHRFQIVEASGAVLMNLTRPAKLIKSTLNVSDSEGATIGRIVQKTTGLIGKTRFDLEVAGNTIGHIASDSWLTSEDFAIQDKDGDGIGRVTKTWPGLAKLLLSKADNYVLEIYKPLEHPLRSLVVAAALAIDVALWQNDTTRR